MTEPALPEPDLFHLPYPGNVFRKREDAERYAWMVSRVAGKSEAVWPYFSDTTVRTYGATCRAQGRAEGEAEIAALKEAIAVAYGWLWHVNNEPMAPVPMWSPEQAAYEARKALRELLTTAERGEAINQCKVAIDARASITKGGAE